MNLDSQIRRSALLLHSLRDDDRSWILSRLPTEQRETLGELLSELKALGIPADQEIIDEVDASHCQQMVRTDIPESPESFFANLSAEHSVVLSQLMKNEPVNLVASFLRIQQWPWREVFLSQMGALRRRQIEDAHDLMERPTKRLCTGMLEIVSRKMQAELQKQSSMTSGNTKLPANKFSHRLKNILPNVLNRGRRA